MSIGTLGRSLGKLRVSLKSELSGPSWQVKEKANKSVLKNNTEEKISKENMITVSLAVSGSQVWGDLIPSSVFQL